MNAPYILLTINCAMISIIFTILKKRKIKWAEMIEKVYLVLAFSCTTIVISLLPFFDILFPKYIYPNPFILLLLIIMLVFFSISFGTVFERICDNIKSP